MRGASLAGLPLISLGTNGHVAWGITAPIEDNSDVWLEELSEDGLKYKVDGEWREMEQVEEIVKVKGQPDRKLKIGITHRGPLMSF